MIVVLVYTVTTAFRSLNDRIIYKEIIIWKKMNLKDLDTLGKSKYESHHVMVTGIMFALFYKVRCFQVLFFFLLFLFGGFYVPLENISLIWRCQNDRKGLQILTCTRQSWLLSSNFKGFFGVHVTGHQFIMIISEDL